VLELLNKVRSLLTRSTEKSKVRKEQGKRGDTFGRAAGRKRGLKVGRYRKKQGGFKTNNHEK